MKTEPEVLSIDSLKKMPKQTACWDGVRNYQARNFMRDEMKIGDLVFIYHSNAEPSGIAGIAKVTREAYPDHTALDKTSEYFDPKSTMENPRWCMVDVTYVEKFKSFLTLNELRQHPEISEMLILKKGNRLSITPLQKKHFDYLCRIGNA
jgi:predicted RNA-binding protein with PUA-like domain